MSILPLLENEFIELKEGFSNFEKDVCAFANHKGGKIYIGVSDKGKIKRVELTNKLHSQIISTINSIEPRPKFEIAQKDGVIVISIEESENKPHKASDGFYLRIGATSQKLKRDEIIQFFISENRVHFDQQINITVTREQEIFNLLNLQQVQWFRNKSGLNEQISDVNLLINLRLIQNKNNDFQITNACLLLFAKDIRQHFSHTETSALLMKDPSTILDQKIITGNILQQLDSIIIYLKSSLLRSYIITRLQRTEVDEIPEFILRELVINGLIHRDYFEQGASLQIKLFPEYIEFSNPGKILHHLKPEDLYGKSFQRNPLLSSIMMRAGYIEKAGTGLIRVAEYLNTNNLKNLKIKEEGLLFNVILPRPTTSQPQATDYKLSKDQTKIMEIISKTTKGISTKQLATKLKYSERKIRLDLLTLKKLELIEAKKEERRTLYFTKNS